MLTTSLSDRFFRASGQVGERSWRGTLKCQYGRVEMLKGRMVGWGMVRETFLGYRHGELRKIECLGMDNWRRGVDGSLGERFAASGSRAFRINGDIFCLLSASSIRCHPVPVLPAERERMKTHRLGSPLFTQDPLLLVSRTVCTFNFLQVMITSHSNVAVPTAHPKINLLVAWTW